jgi:hypothetical protein
MSQETDKEKEKARREEPEHETKIRLELDRSKEIEDLQRQFKVAEEEAKKSKAEVEKLAKEKADLEQEKTNLATEKEDLSEKLKTIAEKEFNAKKSALMDKVKTVFPNADDEKRIKEIQTKLDDPEHGPQNLKETEYMISVLDEALRKGKAQSEAEKKAEEDKKKAASEQKAPTGGETAVLSQAQQTGGNAGKKEEVGFDTYEAMIRELRTRSRDTRDPAKQAEAQALLDELWKKLATQIKKDFEGRTGQNQMAYEEGKEKGDLESLQKTLKHKSVTKEGA